jgi:predicted GTPase
MTEINNKNDIIERNILLIGRTGNGKSTLANVLTETNEFRESSSSISETKSIQVGKFKSQLNGKEIIYKVIDTIGIGDTKLNDKQVLIKIAEVSQELNNGICQILFLTNGRFTSEEIEAYNVMKEVLFGEEITKYITIVRTNFDKFEHEESCKEDKQRIHDENPTLSEILKNCNGIIYVSNPSVDVNQRKSAIDAAIELRGVSRVIIINHLTYNCGNYHPTKLNELSERVKSYMTEKEILEKRLEKEIEEKETIKGLLKQLEDKLQEATKEALE